jgi:Phosphotransferase enzyme family
VRSSSTLTRCKAQARQIAANANMAIQSERAPGLSDSLHSLRDNPLYHCQGVHHDRDHWPIARGGKRGRGIRVGLSRRQTLSLPGEKTHGIPRGCDPRGGRGDGASVPAVWGVLEVGGRWGIVFDRVKERSFAERMREDPSVIPECLQALARLHARIHGQPARQLGSLKSRLATNIAGIGLLGEPTKQILLGRLADMPEGDRLCHGDFHPVNVLGQNFLPMVIDWPDACCGDPAADVCRSYLLLDLHAEDIAEPYLDAYCNITNMPRASVLDWLPYVAAARLAEEVPDDWARLLEIVHA